MFGRTTPPGEGSSSSPPSGPSLVIAPFWNNRSRIFTEETIRIENHRGMGQQQREANSRSENGSLEQDVEQLNLDCHSDCSSISNDSRKHFSTVQQQHTQEGLQQQQQDEEVAANSKPPQAIFIPRLTPEPLASSQTRPKAEGTLNAPSITSSETAFALQSYEKIAAVDESAIQASSSPGATENNNKESTFPGTPSLSRHSRPLAINTKRSELLELGLGDALLSYTSPITTAGGKSLAGLGSTTTDNETITASSVMSDARTAHLLGDRPKRIHRRTTSATTAVTYSVGSIVGNSSMVTTPTCTACFSSSWSHDGASSLQHAGSVQSQQEAPTNSSSAHHRLARARRRARVRQELKYMFGRVATPIRRLAKTEPPKADLKRAGGCLT